jgi:hypothetical protein
MDNNLKTIVDEYFNSVSPQEVVNKLELLRGPCDDYCPYITATCCGLPEAFDLLQAAKKGLFWACHSNNKVPCVATNHDKFPDNVLIITNAEEFIELKNYLK